MIPKGVTARIAAGAAALSDVVQELPGRFQTHRIRADLEAEVIASEDLDRYLTELRTSRLLEYLADKRHWFGQNVDGTTGRGDEFVYGGMDDLGAAHLYALLRDRKPETVVETGVCNGHSTAIVLQALDRNDHGRLYSIDLPETTTGSPDASAFWQGKGGAAVPGDKEPGWVIPEELRDRWELILGRSQDELDPLLEELGTIDAFLHDSEHSYECMSFEFQTAYPALTEGGLLVADDVNWNTAFEDFASQAQAPIRYLSPSVGLLIKASP